MARLSLFRNANSLLVASILGAVSALGGGCGYDAPRISVADAVATERTPDGLAMLFTIEAANDNEEALPLRDVEYSVELDGRPVFSGTRSAEATIRRRGSQRFYLPAVVNLRSDPAFSDSSATSRFRIAGTIQYVTPGQLAEVLFDAGVRVPKADFNLEGQVDLSKARVVTTLGEPLPSGSPLSVEITESAGTPAQSHP